jgi:hypothetical protein
MSPARGELPYVDEHAITIAASRSRVWSALQRYTATSLRIPEGSPIARLPGTQPRAGFEVLDSGPAHSLMLAGRHRFVRCRLNVRPDRRRRGGHATARPDLRAASWRLWPGLPRPGSRHPGSHRRHHPHTVGPAAEPRTGLKPARQARPSPASIIPGQPAHSSHSHADERSFPALLLPLLGYQPAERVHTARPGGSFRSELLSKDPTHRRRQRLV